MRAMAPKASGGWRRGWGPGEMPLEVGQEVREVAGLDPSHGVQLAPTLSEPESMGPHKGSDVVAATLPMVGEEFRQVGARVVEGQAGGCP